MTVLRFASGLLQGSQASRRAHERTALPATTAALALLIAPAAIAASDSAGIPVGEAVAFEQNIEAQLPLETPFVDDTGRNLTLDSVFVGRPAVLMFGYFTCPQLCGVTADGAINALREIRPVIGREFNFVYVSIDPADGPLLAREKKHRDMRRYGRDTDPDSWHYLTGPGESIAAVTGAAGFRFRPVPGTGDFAHASGFIVVRAGGVVSHYFPGLDFAGTEVAAAINEAAAGINGNRVFDLLLVCSAVAAIGGAGAWAFRAVQFGAALAVLALGAGLVHLFRQERRPHGDGRGDGGGT